MVMYPLHCTKAHLSTTLATGREVLLFVRKRGTERIEVLGTGLENVVGVQARINYPVMEAARTWSSLSDSFIT